MLRGLARRVREMAPIRQQQNKNKTEEDSNLNFSSNNETSITSPFQRIPSFLDDDDESEFENGNTKALPEENEFGQLNRAQESQSKRRRRRFKFIYFSFIILREKGNRSGVRWESFEKEII